MTDSEKELRRLAEACEERKHRGYWTADLNALRGALWPKDILALLDRIEALETRNAELQEVANEVESLTEDAANNGSCSDCPYVSQGRAHEILALIRKGRDP